MFTVRWKKSALDDLAACWNLADSEQRKAITAASNLVDQELRHDPVSKGESRPKGRRVFFVPPLGLTYRVDLTMDVVWLLHVWTYRS